jgi:hypothetical protein
MRVDKWGPSEAIVFREIYPDLVSLVPPHVDPGQSAIEPTIFNKNADFPSNMFGTTFRNWIDEFSKGIRNWKKAGVDYVRGELRADTKYKYF